MAQVLRPTRTEGSQDLPRGGKAENSLMSMSAETFVRLIEELVDIKVQYHLANKIKTSPELARIVAVKRETDRHRADQIRAELIQALAAQAGVSA